MSVKQDMAKAMTAGVRANLKSYTDCIFFVNGHCKLSEKCLYRHCLEAVAQKNDCRKWPKQCRDIQCHYRHPALLLNMTKENTGTASPQPLISPSPQPGRLPQQECLISFFWDIENVPIPQGQKPFDIIQRIRDKFVIQAGLLEDSFSCFCNSTTIPQDNQLSLFHANVRIIHVPSSCKRGAADLQILLELDRFERSHRPPATVVLISGDIDFVGKLSDLRHRVGFHIIVIHNKPAKTELKTTVNAHYPWELFTQPVKNNSPPTDVTPIRPLLSYRPTQPGRPHAAAVPTPPPGKARPASASREKKKQLHECPQCTSEFDSLQALRQHQEAKDHTFDCQVCDETFFTFDGQIQHQKAKNHYIDPYICEQCNRRFSKPESLTQHRQATGHIGNMLLSSTASNTRPTTANQNNAVTTEEIIELGIAAISEFWPKIFKP